MGHFRESSYAYLWFTNCTILTTITSTTSIHKGNASSATINTKKTSRLFLPVTYKGEGFSASRRARELILGSNWGRIQFPIHWCRLHVWCPHQCRTLTVERSPLSALVTKLAFLVSIGWQPIVPSPWPSPASPPFSCCARPRPLRTPAGYHGFLYTIRVPQTHW